MNVTFTINSVTRDIQPGWKIDEMIGGRNTMTFKVISLDASWRPQRNQVITLVDDDAVETIFAGHIHTVTERGLGGYGVTALEFTCSATDYTALLDRRRIEVTIPMTDNLKQGLEKIIPFFTPFGMSLDAGQVNGPLFSTVVDEDLVFEGETGTDILNKIQTILSDYAYVVHYDNTLEMFQIGTVNWIPSSMTDFLGDIETEITNVGFANHVTVFYTLEGRAATAYLDNTVNFAAGDTVTIGSKVYTFVTDVVSAPNVGPPPFGNVDGYVKLGGTLQGSLDTLVRAILRYQPATYAGVDYADETIVNSQVSASHSTGGPLMLTALVAGVAGNSIGLATSSATATFKQSGGAVVTTLTLGKEEETLIAEADGGAAAADKVYRYYDHPEVRYHSLAQSLANGYLTRDSATAPSFRLHTLNGGSGVHPGAKYTFTEAKRNLSGSHLVTDVSIFPIGNLVNYTISLKQGVSVVPESPLERYVHWMSKPKPRGSIPGTNTGALSAASVPTGVFSLGGSDFASVLMGPTPTKTAIANYISYFPRIGFAAMIRVWVWSRTGGACDVYLKNVTDTSWPGMASVASGSSRPATPEYMYVVLEAGKEYRLDVVGPADDDVWVIGTLEAA